ncbi:MAG TPA: YfiR family protein [Asticcacaulis sp.]|nr:YfiR family protein [Asticcacaulis sp.]
MLRGRDIGRWRAGFLGIGFLGIGFLGILATTAFVPAPGFADESLAVAVKAAYLYKFAPFITWPAPPSPTAPFTICVVGADPFGAQLDRAVAGQAFGTRPYQVVRLEAIAADSVCNIAYIGGSAKQSVGAGLDAVKGAPVLTVTEDGPRAGTISFKMQAGKVRFRIDQVAASQDGLAISSKLLSLAVSVRTEHGTVEP